jgi:chemotaxis protein methyltransferase CheR
MASLPLSPPLFAILTALIEERIGIHYPLSERDILGEKISTRAVEAGFDSLLDYYYYLRYDSGSGREMDALIDALVVNETYFFREFDQLRFVVDDFLVPLVRAGKRPRLWSAAASSGEEPLTVAMLLAQSGCLDGVEIVASDVSPRILARAREGVFGRRALRNVPVPALVDQYLDVSADRVRVRPQILAAIDYRRVNLLDREQVARLGVFDVILCRNVLIYFREERVKELLPRLADAIAPGGALFVGASESLLRFGTSFVCEERAGVFFYRKSP